MANSFNLSDFGIKTFTYAAYCEKLKTSDISTNAVVNKMAAPLLLDKYRREYVTADLLQGVLMFVNPELYLQNGVIEFADQSQVDRVIAQVNTLLRKNPFYMAELKAYKRKCKDTKANSESIKPETYSERRIKPVAGSRELAFDLLKSIPINCTSGTVIDVSDKAINQTMLHLQSLSVILN